MHRKERKDAKCVAVYIARKDGLPYTPPTLPIFDLTRKMIRAGTNLRRA